MLAFIDEHREPVAYELIRLGLRLRDLPSPGLTYGDVIAIIRQSPPDSAIGRAMGPEARHTTEAELLRSVEYSLRVLTWMKTKDGSKGRRPPQPLTFQWEKPERAFDFDVMSADEADTFLGW